MAEARVGVEHKGREEGIRRDYSRVEVRMDLWAHISHAVSAELLPVATSCCKGPAMGKA